MSRRRGVALRLRLRVLWEHWKDLRLRDGYCVWLRLDPDDLSLLENEGLCGLSIGEWLYEEKVRPGEHRAWVDSLFRTEGGAA